LTSSVIKQVQRTFWPYIFVWWYVIKRVMVLLLITLTSMWNTTLVSVESGSRGEITRAVRKVKNVCAYVPHSCFIVPDQSFGVFSRVYIVTWCSELFHVASVTGCDYEHADIKSHWLWGARRDSVFAGGKC